MRCLLIGWIISASTFCFAQEDSVIFQLILIGGAANTNVDDARQYFSRQIQQHTAPSVFIYLGDNIDPRGLPGPEEKHRKTAEQSLLRQIAMASGLGEMYFIPGNSDWKGGKHEGFHYIMNQQAFFDSLKNSKIHFLPRDGCPGPEEIHLSDDLVLVIIDTQWFLHPWRKPEGENGHCEARSAADVTLQLDDIIDRNKGKRIIVAGHHPVFTNGPYGGVFTLKDHIFPLTQVNKDFYLPLPIVGSLWPLYRKIFGEVQDVSHPLNKAMRRGIQDIMEQYPGNVYASGHEQSLQYIFKDSTHYVVSGSGSESTPVKQKDFSRFASSEKGFVRLLITRGGGAEVEYHSYSTKLFSAKLPDVIPLETEKFTHLVMDSLWVTASASYQYEASTLRKSFLGENYRAEWSQKIPLLAFDIGKERGGLKILQKGGGMETMALRLRDSVGHEYNLRSVEKYPTKAMPMSFQKTFLQSVRQDQVSASHPYAALAIPSLAKAAGIYHTNPRIVYAPFDPRWGIYSKDFAGQIMVFEERPDGIGKDLSFFGNPEKIISTRRLVEHLTQDHDVQVDQKMVLRARLFDMWIGDWDRHDDQFRWGEFDLKKTKTYRPIPRDRDQAFFVNEGIVPNKWRKRYRKPNLEGFDYKIHWTPGLMEVGRWFDRSFLNSLPEKDFVQAAQELALSIHDETIDSALMQWPSEIYQLHGKVIADKMKARRSVIVHNALTYYRFLAKQVDVTGSNKREWFEAAWQPNGNLHLQMYKFDKEGNRGKLLYDREFIKNQTKELRIYGFGGDDLFHFTGNSSRGTLVRIIGGEGKDEVKNESKGHSKIFLYDQIEGVKLEGSKVHNRTSNEPQVNEYDRQSFEYNKFTPKNFLTYNIDDGVFIGTGFSTIAHGFRKKPYQSHHLLTGAYAIKTSSFSIHYEGHFPQAVGKWDLELDGDVRSPNYVNNFFGWGNESVFNQNINEDPNIRVSSSIDYYRLRFREFKGEVKLSRKIGQWSYIKAGPVYQRGEVIDPTGDRYIKDYSASLSEPILGLPKDFGGVTYTVGIDKRDNIGYTTRGIVLKQTSRVMQNFGGSGFTSSNASFTLYQSFRLPARVTYVFNAGGGHNTGAYQLYQAQTLDGIRDIRGFHKTRFYGDTKVYFNNEVRIKLGSLRTYLFPAAIGVHAFYDVGRVWYTDNNGIDPSAVSGISDQWHKSYGGGLWFTPYNLITIVAEVAHSVEGTLFYLRLGFLF